MFLAEEAEKTSTYTGTFTMFDPFVLLFTIVIAIACIRLLSARRKNKFAIGFSVVALLVFLLMDFVMISGW
ncbi:hypothetical protein [Paenibacillus eucommiae]|uniref:Arginine exporter protein ArgO n=1 Tax=Paenibacillus eucommiae TaxID=1355755 RepID=A0ABS4IYL2_9BACL|nr:hypothetical protein [Paenibacillus eucommiae]MBP1992682.1 arginine exporter protein ArgO [Paenibacillus eucommiae]